MWLEASWDLVLLRKLSHNVEEARPCQLPQSVPCDRVPLFGGGQYPGALGRAETSERSAAVGIQGGVGGLGVVVSVQANGTRWAA